MNRLAKELVRIAYSLTAETSKETIDRLISNMEQSDSFGIDEVGLDQSNKIRKDLRDEIKQISTDVLQELFDEIKKRPNIGGWGSGYWTGEVYNEIKEELKRREHYSNWDNRDKANEKEVKLDGGIQVILVQDGIGPRKWSVRTPVRGLAMGYGKTPEEAIEIVNDKINRIGVDKIKEVLEVQDK